MPRQDPAYLYEQTQERTLHEKNLKIEELERQADAFVSDLQEAAARIAALEAAAKKLLDELHWYTPHSTAQRDAESELRALLNGGGK